MNVALLLPLRGERLFYGEDFVAAGSVCLMVAFLLVLTMWIVKRKKRPVWLPYWLRVLFGSGMAMIILGLVLDALNPGVGPVMR